MRRRRTRRGRGNEALRRGGAAHRTAPRRRLGGGRPRLGRGPPARMSVVSGSAGADRRAGAGVAQRHRRAREPARPQRSGRPGDGPRRQRASELDPAGTDPKLKPIAPQLESFGEQFRFRSYRLIDEQTFDLDWKSAAQVELPGSRSLQVTPRQLDADGRIKVHLELLGEHPEHTRKLHTDYAIQRGGTLLVGGIRVDPRDEKAGKLLIAITQQVEK